MNNIAQSNPEGELERLGGESARVAEKERDVVEKTKTKKAKKWPVVILAVVAILGVTLGIAMTILWLQERERVSTVKIEEKTEVVERVGDTITITTESSGEHEREIKELLADLAEKIPEWVNIRTNMGVKMPPRVTFVYDAATYPLLYQPEDLKISVILNRTYGLMLDSNSYTDSASVRQQFTDAFVSVVPGKIQDYLMDKGFSQYGGYDDEFIKDGMVCQVGFSWPDAAIQCAYKDWYDAKIAAFSNEVAIGAGYPEGEYLGLDPDDLNIEDSRYEPYQRMTGGVLGAAGLWYRVSPDAEWQWFMGTQVALECSDYDTDDLKRAFLGEYCTENGENSEVKL